MKGTAWRDKTSIRHLLRYETDFRIIRQGTEYNVVNMLTVLMEKIDNM